MISLLKKTFVTLSTVAIMVPSFAFAAVLDVDFQATPLFLNADVKPGDAEARTVTVTNLGTEPQAVYVSVQNTFSDGLADVMQLNVSDGVNTYFSGDFSNFFSTTPLTLGTLLGGTSRTYTFSASLASSIGNDYQTKTFGFDLIIGFEGGESTTDDGGGGGGGGGGSKYVFTIFNELVADVDNAGHSATLTWNTNHNSSTYLVCGNIIDGPFTLDPNAPLFGYKFDVPEVAVNNISHQVILTNLAFGTYECRPVSRPTLSSPFTVGKDLHFSIVPSGEVLGDNTTPAPTPFAGYTGNLNKPSEPTGSVLGVSTSSSSPEENAPGDVLGVKAERTESMSDKGGCELWWLILLAVISFSWSLIEDVIRKTRSYFKNLFLRNTIFTIVYVFVLYFSQMKDLLNKYWYIPAIAWLLMTIFDYRAHRYEFPEWSAVSRNIYYMLLGILFVITYYFFGFPCVRLPFALIALGSLLLLVLQPLKKSHN